MCVASAAHKGAESLRLPRCEEENGPDQKHLSVAVARRLGLPSAHSLWRLFCLRAAGLVCSLWVEFGRVTRTDAQLHVLLKRKWNQIRCSGIGLELQTFCQQNEGHGQRQMIEAVDVRIIPLLEDEKIHKVTGGSTRNEEKTELHPNNFNQEEELQSFTWTEISPRSRSAASEPELRSSILDRPAACKPTSLDKPTSAASSSAAATTTASHVLSSTTDPFDGDDEDGRSDGSGVDPVAPAVLVDPHSDGQNSKHGDGRTLRFVKVAQSCKLWFWTFMEIKTEQILTDQSDPHGERRAINAEIFQDVVSHEAQDGQTWTITRMNSNQKHPPEPELNVSPR